MLIALLVPLTLAILGFALILMRAAIALSRDVMALVNEVPVPASMPTSEVEPNSDCSRSR